MYYRLIPLVFVVAGALCLAALADDQATQQKSGKSDSTTQPAQGTPGMMGKGMMGKDMGGMMGGPMMGGPMMDRGMKMMQMHQKMQDEMKAMDDEAEKLVAEMNQATGQNKIDAMAKLLTRLVEQRKTMTEKMGTMHADMMKMMMEGMGPDSGRPSSTSKSSTNNDMTDHSQHQP
jgi:hypothetical protein